MNEDEWQKRKEEDATVNTYGTAPHGLDWSYDFNQPDQRMYPGARCTREIVEGFIAGQEGVVSTS
jgi:hypothetical protein